MTNVNKDWPLPVHRGAETLDVNPSASLIYHELKDL